MKSLVESMKNRKINSLKENLFKQATSLEENTEKKDEKFKADFDKFVKLGGDVNSPHKTFGKLVDAVANYGRSEPVVLSVIDSGAEFDPDYMLNVSAQNGYVKLAEKSLEKGADINKAEIYMNRDTRNEEWQEAPNVFYAHTPLSLATYNNNEKMADFLVEKGASPVIPMKDASENSVIHNPRNDPNSLQHDIDDSVKSYVKSKGLDKNIASQKDNVAIQAQLKQKGMAR